VFAHFQTHNKFFEKKFLRIKIHTHPAIFQPVFARPGILPVPARGAVFGTDGTTSAE